VPVGVQGVQAWDRYAYVNNNPINYTDPTGHWPEPPPIPNPYDYIQQAVHFFTNLVYSVVGNPMSKSIYSNGADIVAQKINEAGQIVETLCIECKQVSGSVNLGTLGKNVDGHPGGSLQQTMKTATRIQNTSRPQLRAEIDAIRQGYAAGNLKNALYTSARHVSDGARNVFNYVYPADASGAAQAAKEIGAIASNAINMPFLAVPYMLLDPSHNPALRQYSTPTPQ
jgi:hypothetical protein